MTLPDGWVNRLLADLVVPNGISYGIVQPGKPVRNGVPIVRVADLRDGGITSGDVKRVAAHVEASYPRSRLRGGEVLLSLVGSVGQVAAVPKSFAGWNVARAVGVIRPSPSVGAYWIAACLRSPLLQYWMNVWKTTTVQETLNLRDVARLPIPCPPRPERDRILLVLGALDDKIELNRRMNETLEALARTAFERMKSAGGSAAELGEHAEVIRGRSYKSSELGPSTNALVTLKSFARGGGYRSDGLKPYTGEFKPAQIVAPGEVVVACTDVTQAAEVIGRPAVVLLDPRYERFIASLDLVIVRPKRGLSTPFVYLLLGSADFTEHAYAHTTGTTVLHLDRSCIPSYEFTLPRAEALADFDRVARPLFDRIAVNHAESRTLAELRDALLPKLISGELRVRDGEAAVESAGT